MENVMPKSYEEQKNDFWLYTLKCLPRVSNIHNPSLLCRLILNGRIIIIRRHKIEFSIQFDLIICYLKFVYIQLLINVKQDSYGLGKLMVDI